MSQQRRSRRRWVRVVLWGLAVVACALAAATAFFLKRPITCFEALGRLGLRNAGFARTAIETARGPLVYWHGGRGEVVVLLHGANDYAGTWAKVAGPLAASHRVLVPDLPGHGQSAPGAGPLYFQDLLAGLERLLEAERGDRPVTLVGNSMGGFLAVACARAHPAWVHRVVLVNGATLTGEANGIQLQPRTREEARHAMRALSGPAAPPVPDFVLDDLVRRAPQSPLARLAPASLAPYLLDGHLGDVTVPVTLLWGEADRLMPVQYARRVAEELSRAELTLIPGCGHMPQRECPEKLLPLLTAVLAPPPTAGAK